MMIRLSLRNLSLLLALVPILVGCDRAPQLSSKQKEPVEKFEGIDLSMESLIDLMAAKHKADVEDAQSKGLKWSAGLVTSKEELIYTGKAYQVITDYRDGRSDITAYRCLPDTFKPK